MKECDTISSQACRFGLLEDVFHRWNSFEDQKSVKREGVKATVASHFDGSSGEMAFR